MSLSMSQVVRMRALLPIEVSAHLSRWANFRAADYFYWHLWRTPGVENDTEKGQADFVEIVAVNMISCPLPRSVNAGRTSTYNLTIEERYMIGRLLINKSSVALYAAFISAIATEHQWVGVWLNYQ